MRFLALIAALALAACVSNGPVGPSASDVEACSAQSGFSARAKAEHASGVQGDIPGTPEELAAINACLKAKEPVLRDIGGIPQTIETKVTGPTTKTETHSMAPAAKAAAKPRASTAPRGCTYAMVGGTSYVCKPH
jgi:ABC-type Fe3+-hydroxamate transport system substrate-binding protein